MQSALPLEENYATPLTYADYAQIDDGKRYELFEGALIWAGPAPGDTHQSVSGELQAAIWNNLRSKTCRVYAAPYDVILPEGDADYSTAKTVLQPDIVVLCDMSKRRKQGCVGAPDMVIEILSPSSVEKDLQTKRAIYEKHGVREYWIIDPARRHALVMNLEAGVYNIIRIVREAEQLTSTVLPDLCITLGNLFTDLLPE